MERNKINIVNNVNKNVIVKSNNLKLVKLYIAHKLILKTNLFKTIYMK